MNKINCYKYICLFALMMLVLNSCGPLKYKKVRAKDYPPDPKLIVKKNIEEGRGFRLSNLGAKKGGTFDFASSKFTGLGRKLMQFPSQISEF